jgi:hypothetical protein
LIRRFGAENVAFLDANGCFVVGAPARAGAARTDPRSSRRLVVEIRPAADGSQTFDLKVIPQEIELEGGPGGTTGEGRVRKGLDEDGMELARYVLEDLKLAILSTHLDAEID